MTTAAAHDLVATAKGIFKARFGFAPASAAAAPGRINLIGEQIDFLGATVLPVAINRWVAIALAPAQTWALESDTTGGLRMLQALCAELGVGPQSAAAVANLPVGAGLSSSAAFLIAASAALGSRQTAREAALGAQRAEQSARGVLCGVMDHYAAAAGRRGYAMLLDCDRVDHVYVQIPPTAVMAVVDSGIRRELSATPYNQRRQEVIDGVREAGLSIRAIPEGHGNPRLRHVAGEIGRVSAMIEALEAADLVWAGRLIRESHASLRDNYQCSLPPIDDLVARADSVPGCYGSRIMGGGFGGSVLALLARGEEPAFLSVFPDAEILESASGAFVHS
ncbi:MAG TPA: galactokinase family protein [Candidatus Dormibacteraeota bacterium]|nr:galactokinase family protein [Candidatus Dormibacteraeota bacterium]